MMEEEGAVTTHAHLTQTCAPIESIFRFKNDHLSSSRINIYSIFNSCGILSCLMLTSEHCFAQANFLN